MKLSLRSLQNLKIALGMLTVSLIVRGILIIFPAVVDWDESTFFLVASRLAQGELPYTSTLENKPPLAVFLQAIFMRLGIDNPQALRFVSTVIVAICAYVVAQISSTLLHPLLRFITGIVFIAMYSLIPGGMGWMTELNVLFVFLVSLQMILKFKDHSSLYLFVLGNLIGSIPWIRTNWAPITVFLTLWMLRLLWHSKSKIPFLIGIAAPSVSVFVIYFIADNLEQLYKGAFLVPKAFISGARGNLGVTKEMFIPFLIIIILLSVSFYRHSKSREPQEKAFDLILLSLSSLIFSASMFQYPDYSHHALQIVPFVCLSFSRILLSFRENLDGLRSPIKGFILAATAVAIFTPFFVQPIWSLEQDRLHLIKDKWQQQESVIKHLREISEIEDQVIWAIDEHYVYFRLDKKPFVPEVAHPSMISNENVLRTITGLPTTTRGYLKLILRDKPDIIIKRVSDSWYFNRGARQLIEEFTYRFYTAEIINGVYVWRLKASQ